VRGRVPRSRSEEAEALQSELLIRTKAWEKAEAGFTLANAVRVAGPDRILFCRKSPAVGCSHSESASVRAKILSFPGWRIDTLK